MDLHSVRSNVKAVLAKHGVSQDEFARRHGLSSSWLNKFLRAELNNPRYLSLKRLEDAVSAERRGVAPRAARRARAAHTRSG